MRINFRQMTEYHGNIEGRIKGSTALLVVRGPDRGHVHPTRSKIPPMVSEAHGCPKYGLGWHHRSFWVQTLFFERFLGLGENQYFAHLAIWEVCICIHNT